MAESKFSRVELELSASNVMRKLRMPALGLGAALGLTACQGEPPPVVVQRTAEQRGAALDD